MIFLTSSCCCYYSIIVCAEVLFGTASLLQGRGKIYVTHYPPQTPLVRLYWVVVVVDIFDFL